MSVLKNLKNGFILHLVKTLESKIYFGLRRYRSSNFIVFPPFECKNYGLALLRLKPAVYYEISKAGSSDGVGLVLNLPDETITEFISEEKGYDDIVFKYLTQRNVEDGCIYLGIILYGITFFPDDFPHSWEHGDFDIFRRWGNPDFYNEDENIWGNPLPIEELENMPDEREDWEIKNGNSSFREEECVICKDTIPNIMFCNCGHIVVCEGCDTTNLRKCPLCKTPCRIKRKL